MQRPNWPGLERRKSRHGKVCWYVRVGHGPRHRLKCEPGGAGFRVEYETALATMLKGEKPVEGSVQGYLELALDAVRQLVGLGQAGPVHP